MGKDLTSKQKKEERERGEKREQNDEQQEHRFATMLNEFQYSEVFNM